MARHSAVVLPLPGLKVVRRLAEGDEAPVEVTRRAIKVDYVTSIDELLELALQPASAVVATVREWSRLTPTRSSLLRDVPFVGLRKVGGSVPSDRHTLVLSQLYVERPDRFVPAFDLSLDRVGDLLGPYDEG